MTQFKIVGGTPKLGPSLCATCKYASIVKGQNMEELINCGGHQFPHGRVTFRVSECGKYHPMNMPWLYEMREIAWNIEAKKRGPVGFEPPKDELEIVITPPKDACDPLDHIE